jgi:hypothetical protein
VLRSLCGAELKVIIEITIKSLPALVLRSLCGAGLKIIIKPSPALSVWCRIENHHQTLTGALCVVQGEIGVGGGGLALVNVEGDVNIRDSHFQLNRAYVSRLFSVVVYYMK